MDRFPSRERSTSASLEPRVSAIVGVRPILATRTRQSPLDLCLRSVMAEPWVDDIVVIDQARNEVVSSALRGLEADRRDVKVIRSEAGQSFGAMANLGASYARGRWLLFIDPDVVLQRGAVSRMAAAGGDARTPWIVGGRLTDMEGRERTGARGGALNTFSSISVALGLPGPKPKKSRRRASEGAGMPVAAVSGAFMLVPKSDFHALGGFDESFVAEGADLDLCWRTADAGGSVLFQPDASGVQFARLNRRRRQAQGLARFAAKSARTPMEKAFALVAGPALLTLVAFKDFVIGRPPLRR